MPLITNAFTDQDAVDSGNDALLTQAARLAQRKKDLQDQVAAVAQQGQPQGQMVSGRYVKPAASQQLLPMIGQAVVEFKKQALDKESSEYDRRVAEAAMRHLSSVPRADATPEAKLAWAQRGAQIPTVAPMMQAYMNDQLVAEPARVEARDERKQKQADAIAEGKRKQADELTYRRERDQQRVDDNAANRDLRATLAAAVRSHGGGDGDKASNYQIVPDKEGNLTRVNKLTGETMPLGQGGKPTSTFEKGQADDAKKVSNAKEALTLLKEMDPLIDSATHSGAGSAIDKGLRVVGASTKAGDSASALNNKAKNLAAYADRGMFGPQFSDADVRALNEAVGNLGDPTIPISQKRAAYNSVVSKFKRQAGMREDDKTVRGALEDAVKKHSSSSSVDDLVNKYSR